jgi:hypothetical protein
MGMGHPDGHAKETVEQFHHPVCLQLRRETGESAQIREHDHGFTALGPVEQVRRPSVAGCEQIFHQFRAKIAAEQCSHLTKARLLEGLPGLTPAHQ